jgi:hypothetical protein
MGKIFLTLSLQRIFVASDTTMALLFITDSSKENLVALGEADLTYDHTHIFLVFTSVTHASFLQSSVIADSINHFEIMGHCNTREIGVLFLGFEYSCEIMANLPGIDHTISSTRGENSIISRPQKMSDTAIVSFKRPDFGFSSIGVENLNGLIIIGTIYSGKVLTSVGKLDLLASLERDFFEIFDLVIVEDDRHHF